MVNVGRIFLKKKQVASVTCSAKKNEAQKSKRRRRRRKVTENDTRFLESLTRQVILSISKVIRDRQGAIKDVQKLIDWIEKKDKKMAQVKKFVTKHGNQELKNYAASVSCHKK
jgi:hypothetical protein